MHVEQLENRRLMAAFTASSVAELISDINAANAAGGSNTIALAVGATFKLNAAISPVNVDDGPNGLPQVAAGDDLTIIGNGDIIQRSTPKGTPAFRLFDVAIGGSLTLNNLTLSGGLANTSSTFGISGLAGGGGVLNRGTLSLNCVTVGNCIAQAQSGDWAFGGGIFSNGTLTIANSTIQNNQALGGSGYGTASGIPFPGRPGLGGGLYIAGSASITNVDVVARKTSPPLAPRQRSNATSSVLRRAKRCAAKATVMPDSNAVSSAAKRINASPRSNAVRRFCCDCSTVMSSDPSGRCAVR
jgi:hypothetical protein